MVTLSLWTTAATDAGFSAVADVYGPDGSVVASSVGALRDLGPLTAAGTYTMRVRDDSDTWNGGSQRGQYVLELHWRAPVARVCGVTGLTCGTPVAGTIATLGDTADLHVCGARSGTW